MNLTFRFLLPDRNGRKNMAFRFPAARILLPDKSRILAGSHGIHLNQAESGDLWQQGQKCQLFRSATVWRVQNRQIYKEGRIFFPFFMRQKEQKSIDFLIFTILKQLLKWLLMSSWLLILHLKNKFAWWPWGEPHWYWQRLTAGSY